MKRTCLAGAVLALGLVACGGESTLVVRPTTPAPAEIVPTPQLQEFAYKQLLVLAPEVGVAVDEGIEVPLIRDRGPSYYMGRLEKLLLSQGFQVISSEIVARVGQKAQGAGSAVARALVMGKETHADAVLMVQSIAVAHADKFYHLEDFSEVEPGLRVEEDGEYRHKETDACLFRLPFYEVRMEAKMIDVQSGNVLWVGSARETMLDALAESWTAKLDDECKVESQSPFIYRDELNSEETFDRTVTKLYDRMFVPLKKLALSLFGEKAVFETPKPEALLARIIQIATNEGDLVLDSFAGSGTTGATAHKLHRRWIMVELHEHADTLIRPRLQKVIDGQDPGGVTDSTNWKGGGGFRYYRLAPSLLKRDKWGNWVINKAYNAAMLAEALCKLEGFVYAPNEAVYWEHGHSTERDFIYVTTQHLTHEQLVQLSADVGPERSLLVMCTAFRGRADAWPNLTIKKIPKTVLSRCEWGHDDYSLEVANLTPATPPAGQQGLGFED